MKEVTRSLPLSLMIFCEHILMYMLLYRNKSSINQSINLFATNFEPKYTLDKDKVLPLEAIAQVQLISYHNSSSKSYCSLQLRQ